MAAATVRRFRDLHAGPEPFVMPNAWDPGSTRLLVDLGFAAVATSSGGFAASLGRADGEVSRDDVLAHAAALVAVAGDVPVSADLEDCYGDDPADAAATVEAAVAVGLAGVSIEDFDPRRGGLLEIDRARAKVEAAAEAAHRGPEPAVLTARAETFLRGPADLDDAVRRLQAYQEAGADVLYAPGLTDADDIARLVAALDRPVNVLLLPGVPPVGELARLGVRRVSTGGGLARLAYGTVREAARRLLEDGTSPV